MRLEIRNGQVSVHWEWSVDLEVIRSTEGSDDE